MAQARTRRARRGPRLGSRLASRPAVGAGGRVAGPTVLASALFALECSLYSAVTPLLPHYVAAYHLSKAAAGVLAASYSVGFLAGAPLGGWLASRDIRGTVVAGLALFAASAVLFGLAQGALSLDLTRAAQGIAGGIIWGGGLLWLIAATLPARRGSALGFAFGASTAGTLLGPVLGTVAVSTGSVVVFGVIGAVASALALSVGRLHAPPAHVALARIGPAAASRQPALLMSGSVMAAVGVTLGAIGVLVPLRLASEGASGVAVGVTFLLAAALAALVAPLAGVVTDRRGPLVPVRRALITVSAGLVGLAFAEHSTLVALLTVVCVAGAAGGCIGPCVVLGTTASERFGVSLAATVAMLNLAFASGESAGAIAGPRLSEASGELATLLALACLVGLVAVATSAAVRGGLAVALGDGGPSARSKRLRSAPACDLGIRDASSLAPFPHDQAS